MLFSDWHAVTQALQPVQVLRSIDMPHCWRPGNLSSWPFQAATFGATVWFGCS
jgi:hypothetical protein